ncbi:hypothetical protein D6779_09625 [Candidatus Parcubacteria bacterium]|nr:MAG: hypothetical protein D6779_09625 [Candidatus Parcubacteria bacterium]
MLNVCLYRIEEEFEERRDPCRDTLQWIVQWARPHWEAPHYYDVISEEYRDRGDAKYYNVGPAHGYWVHVVRYSDMAPIGLTRLVNYHGEICVSLAGDEYIRPDRKAVEKNGLMAVVFDGHADWLFEADRWSDQSIVNGRRYFYVPYGHPGNQKRHEAWIVPAQCRLVAVCFSSERKAEEFKSEGWPVEMISSLKDLDKYHFNSHRRQCTCLQKKWKMRKREVDIETLEELVEKHGGLKNIAGI